MRKALKRKIGNTRSWNGARGQERGIESDVGPGGEGKEIRRGGKSKFYQPGREGMKAHNIKQ